MSAETLRGLDSVYTGEEGRGWILGWDLPRTSRDLSAQTEQRVQLGILSLLESLSLPPNACLWTAWNIFALQVPTLWQSEKAGPLDERWNEARLFHDRLEIRLQRTPALLRLRILTEEDSIRTAAERMGQEYIPHACAVAAAEPYRTLPGRVLLAGRPLSLNGFAPPGSRGEIQYPRLLHYLGTNGPPGSTDRSGRVGMKVMRYFDGMHRLRAVRYRTWEA